MMIFDEIDEVEVISDDTKTMEDTQHNKSTENKEQESNVTNTSKEQIAKSNEVMEDLEDTQDLENEENLDSEEDLSNDTKVIIDNNFAFMVDRYNFTLYVKSSGGIYKRYGYYQSFLNLATAIFDYYHKEEIKNVTTIEELNKHIKDLENIKNDIIKNLNNITVSDLRKR